MKPLLPAQRRAERFADLVDGATTGDPGGRDARFVELVGALRGVAAEAPAPRAEHVADLRARLMAEAETALIPTDARLVLPRRSPPRQNRAKAAVVALVLVGGTAGVAVAAEHSRPGDLLYPLKRGIEHVTESFSFSDAGRGRDELHQAGARLDEVDAMLAGGGSQTAVVADLRSFDASAGQGSDLLFRSYRSGGGSSSVTTVRDFADTSMATLTRLAPDAPAELRPELARAAAVVAGVDREAHALCPGCGRAASVVVPRVLAPTTGLLGGPGDVPATGVPAPTATPSPTRPGSGSTTGGRSPGAGPGSALVTVPGTSGLPGGNPLGGVPSSIAGSGPHVTKSPGGGGLLHLPSTTPSVPPLPSVSGSILAPVTSGLVTLPPLGGP